MVNVSISFLVFGVNDNGGNTCLSFFKTELVSHSIKFCSHGNFLNPILVYVVKIMKGPVKNLAISGVLFRFLTLPSGSG